MTILLPLSVSVGIAFAKLVPMPTVRRRAAIRASLLVERDIYLVFKVCLFFFTGCLHNKDNDKIKYYAIYSTLNGIIPF